MAPWTVALWWSLATGLALGQEQGGSGVLDVMLAAGESSALLGAPSAQAPCVTVNKPNVRLHLLTDRPELVRGQPFELAVKFELDEGWHLYSGLNPGGIGLPTRIDWRLPEGWVASRIVWPGPQRYAEPSGHTSYVHDGELVLTSHVEVPGDAALGEVKLGVELDYQVCHDKCVLGKASLELPVSVVAARTVFPSADCRRTFDEAAALLPQVAIDGFTTTHTWSQSPLRPGDRIVGVVQIDPPAGGRVQAEVDGIRPLWVVEQHEAVEVEVLEVREQPQGGLRIIARAEAHRDRLPTSGELTLAGVVQVDLMPAGAQAPTPASFDVPLRFTLGPVDSAVTALSSPLLAGLELAALAPAELPPAEPMPPPSSAPMPLWQALFFAFVGGLILNIMPCVLPVLSLKALSLVEEAEQSQRKVQSFVGMYVLGVLASFWALAAVVVTLKYSGEFVGWGFQFQEPSYVLVMIAVVFAFALSMFGVFEVPGLTTRGEQSGLKGSFVHGVMTTALSTPCSAPFLGPAIAFALSQSPVIIFGSFSVIGLGLATPIAVITLAPAFRRFIPKPGMWMETFKHVVGFLLIGTVIWLLGVLAKQLTPSALTSVMVLLGAVSFAAWLLGRFTGPLAGTRSKVLATLAAVATLGVAVPYVSLEAPEAGAESLATERIAWIPFAGEETMALARQGHTVFIDFTADWCATCKTMEATAIETDAVSKLIRENGIVAVKADLTRKNPEISRWIEFYGRAAIPLYVILPAGRPDAPLVLPEVITEELLLEKLRQAGPSSATAVEEKALPAAARGAG